MKRITSIICFFIIILFQTIISQNVENSNFSTTSVQGGNDVLGRPLLEGTLNPEVVSSSNVEVTDLTAYMFFKDAFDSSIPAFSTQTPTVTYSVEGNNIVFETYGSIGSTPWESKLGVNLYVHYNENGVNKTKTLSHGLFGPLNTRPVPFKRAISGGCTGECSEQVSISWDQGWDAEFVKLIIKNKDSGEVLVNNDDDPFWTYTGYFDRDDIDRIEVQVGVGNRRYGTVWSNKYVYDIAPCYDLANIDINSVSYNATKNMVNFSLYFSYPCSATSRSWKVKRSSSADITGTWTTVALGTINDVYWTAKDSQPPSGLWYYRLFCTYTDACGSVRNPYSSAKSCTVSSGTNGKILP
ncbi:MAG: hypothetical protein PVH88_02045 [Ignavibacteria bacterium]|jgi:hypothetical protein